MTINTVFPYPGGKSRYADWIIDQFPEHKCYTEPFCGSSSVLLQKPKSEVEVINDLDSDIIQFFKIFRDSPDELVEWLEKVPYSEELYDGWVQSFYNGERHSDSIERAGRFFFLRRTQFGGDMTRPNGMRKTNGNARSCQAKSFVNAVSELDLLAERYRRVQIMNSDYESFFDTYDGEKTFHYCDPPYMDEGDDLYTHEGEFDHERFVECLESLEGKWCVSYTRVPEGLHDYRIVERETNQHMAYSDGELDTRTERLIMNYDPDVSKHSAAKSVKNMDW